jgi:hypothetical protein
MHHVHRPPPVVRREPPAVPGRAGPLASAHDEWDERRAGGSSGCMMASFDLPTPWRAYADIDALWYRDQEAARARVAVMHDGR